MSYSMPISAEELRALLAYDPTTGLFTWKVRASCRSKPGMRAGSASKSGRIYIQIYGRAYQAHRLAWLHVHGEWPGQHIDHINGNPLDNRVENLRDVSRSVNQQNQRKAQVHNSTGFMGVTRAGKKFQASLMLKGKRIYLGVFETPEEAHVAYVAGKRRLHEGCTI